METGGATITEIEEPILSRLFLTLEDLIKQYQQLLSVLQLEKGLMIEGNLNELCFCLNQKDGILEEIQKTETRRGKEVEHLAQRFRLTSESSEGVSLRQIINVVSFSYRGRLLSCHDRLRALLAAVTEINQINGLLVGRILQQVNALIGLLSHLSMAPQTYQSSGQSSGLFGGDFQSGRPYRATGALHLRG
ncbi:MAG: flagellar protein FlgN [Nitrospirota bacterium]